ncbi:MAG TPA: hypothetical protein VMN58_01280 [Acidimicrobiales bacterium]|nr:hypothetical protein [Acidimicrobiales bacterium]
MEERLSADEDQWLRALHWLECMGMQLSPPLAELKAELLARDLRAAVREPKWEEILPPTTPPATAGPATAPPVTAVDDDG